MRWSGPRFITGFASVILSAAPAISQTGRSDEVLLRLRGVDFAEGAKESFGADKYGEQVNYVYAQPTGPQARMRATFTIERAPGVPLFLHLRARDDDGPGKCAIEITLNGTSLLRGQSGFPDDQWQTCRIPIPTAVLKTGINELVIHSLEQDGKLGMPPWFMVATCVLAGQDYRWRPDITKEFFVTLPPAIRPLPEPLPAGQEPGFKFRGIKGWMWRPEQYLAEIPVLAEYKLTFLMNCYGSMCDIEHHVWGDPRVNRWWEPLPVAKRLAYEKVVRTCQQAGLQFCFSMNPNLCSQRPVKYDNSEDVDALWQHYTWMQGLGVKWFNISLDDISAGIDAPGQAALVNEIFRRLRAKDPQAQMIFCPTWYWGAGTGEEERPYLETLARELHVGIYLFWTGDSVVGRVTRKGAESYRNTVKHRLFLWDNYPVNDAQPTMHLGPVTGRDSDVCEIVDGYMSNSMCTQNEANRIPLLTCADYAYNPKAYDPARSIGQSILHLAANDEQQRALKDLVEAYSGMLLRGAGTNFNAVRDQFTRLASAPHSRHVAEMYVRHLEDLLSRMRQAFPEQFEPARKTLADDIAWMKRASASKYGEGEAD
jgi:hypothetical protein